MLSTLTGQGKNQHSIWKSPVHEHTRHTRLHLHFLWCDTESISAWKFWLHYLGFQQQLFRNRPSFWRDIGVANEGADPHQARAYEVTPIVLSLEEALECFLTRACRAYSLYRRSISGEKPPLAHTPSQWEMARSIQNVVDLYVTIANVTCMTQHIQILASWNWKGDKNQRAANIISNMRHTILTKEISWLKDLPNVQVSWAMKKSLNSIQAIGTAIRT